MGCFAHPGRRYPDLAEQAATSVLKLQRMKNSFGLIRPDSCQLWPKVQLLWSRLLGVACFLLICFFLWHLVSHVRHRQLLRACCSFTPTRPKGGGDEAAVGWHAKWNAHSHGACLNSSVWDLSCRELFNFTANQDSSAPSLGPQFVALLPGFAWFPHLVLICSVAPPREKSAFMGLLGKTSRMAVQFEESSIWVYFILKLAGGLLAARTIRMMWKESIFILFNVVCKL